jgi:hypothetical protein
MKNVFHYYKLCICNSFLAISEYIRYVDDLN